MGRWHTGVVALLLAGCPNQPEPTQGGGEGSASGATTGTPIPPGTSASQTSFASSDGGVRLDIPTPEPTAGGCDSPGPAPEVVVPEGCTSVPLLDENREVLPDRPSGLVTCTDTDADQSDQAIVSVYRVADVPCPFATGECLCDADCPANSRCICDNASALGFPDPGGNHCLPADCASDADCPGQRCRGESGFCGFAYNKASAFHCTSPEDDCSTNGACIAQNEQHCAYDEQTELFTCSPGAICE